MSTGTNDESSAFLGQGASQPKRTKTRSAAKGRSSKAAGKPVRRRGTTRRGKQGSGY